MVPSDPELCEGCSRRKGKYFKYGYLLCWVCEYVRLPMPMWLQWIPDFIDWVTTRIGEDHKNG